LLVEPSPTRRIPILRLTSGVFAVVLAFYAWRFFYTDLQLGAASASLDRGYLSTALLEYDYGARSAPAGSSADLYFSRRLANYVRNSFDVQLKAQALPAAYNTALNATRTSEERSNAWYNLAGFLSATNSPADVERSLRESINAAPNWYKPHWILAQLYLAEKRLDDAQHEAETALACNGKAPEVLSTFENIRAARRH
jgi:predicted Zn-dependent protease